MNGDAVLTVELRLHGIDLHGVETFVNYAHGELASALHQQVSPMPGIGVDVVGVAWTPDQEKK